MTQTESPILAATSQKWLQCNGQQLRKLMHAGLLWLEKHCQTVNELNVFPVPDGDTGTNMVLTMQSAYGRIQDNDDLHVGKMANQLAQGALMGARGNSGVILSQILRGLARKLREKETFIAEDLAEAFQEAADTAYHGVMKPVEGTILTIIRESAEEATDAAGKSADLRFLMERVVERSQQALERTPDLLPILKQAGVVDSGGQGLVFIFEGMLRYVTGEIDGLQLETAVAFTAAAPAQAFAVPDSGHLENPYDVQFILMGENLNVPDVRQTIDAMGDSTVVVGDERTIKVHIHVQDPGEPISYGISLGNITDVVVENMQMQMEEIVGELAPSPVEAEPEVHIEPGQIGVVAIAAGDGLSKIFSSLGAAHIVNGGQTNNPSTEEIFQAIQDVPTDKIIILPNNKNIFLAADAARDLSPKNVFVVPTRTAPQGISAMLNLHPDGDLYDVTQAMTLALTQVATGEITTATRSVNLDGVDVKEGEVIGMVDGRLYASGTQIVEVLTVVLEGMDMDEREIVSLYYGADMTPEEAATMAEEIERQFPDVEVETLPGGQPYYYYILGAE